MFSKPVQDICRYITHQTSQLCNLQRDNCKSRCYVGVLQLKVTRQHGPGTIQVVHLSSHQLIATNMAPMATSVWHNPGQCHYTGSGHRN